MFGSVSLSHARILLKYHDMARSSKQNENVSTSLSRLLYQNHYMARLGTPSDKKTSVYYNGYKGGGGRSKVFIKK